MSVLQQGRDHGTGHHKYQLPARADDRTFAEGDHGPVGVFGFVQPALGPEAVCMREVGLVTVEIRSVDEYRAVSGHDPVRLLYFPGS